MISWESDLPGTDFLWASLLDAGSFPSWPGARRFLTSSNNKATRPMALQRPMAQGPATTSSNIASWEIPQRWKVNGETITTCEIFSCQIWLTYGVAGDYFFTSFWTPKWTKQYNWDFSEFKYHIDAPTHTVLHAHTQKRTRRQTKSYTIIETRFSLKSEKTMICQTGAGKWTLVKPANTTCNAVVDGMGSHPWW